MERIIPTLSPNMAEIPTPPDSPRKRRRHLRDSDDTSGDMTIEGYLYRSDPYRSTTMSKPWPYPLKAVSAPESVRLQIEPHRGEILAILRNHGFPQQPIFTVDNITKPGYPGGEIPITVLRLVFRFDTYVPKSMGPAKDAVYDLLIRNKIEDVHVEIVQYEMCFKPSFFAIDAHDPAARTYELARADIIHLLHEKLGNSWSLVCVFNVGRTEDKASPCVVVLVDPGTVLDWSILDFNVRDRLRRRNVFIEIQVEFLPGMLSRSMSPPEEAVEGHPGVSFRTRMANDGRPEMGFSIGVVGKKDGGTMGGFFTLTQNGVTKAGILTNYHVVQPPDSAGEDEILRADRFGTSPSQTDASHVDVVYLADKDITETAYDLEQVIDMNQKKISELTEEQQSRALVGARPSIRLERNIGIRTEEESQCRQKLEVVRSMPLCLGTVVASSGKSLIESRILDWAFIQLEDEVSAKFFGPNRMPAIPQSLTPWEFGYRAIAQAAGLPLEKFGDIQKNDYYIKVGRTTNLTAGLCNGVVANCHWRERDRLRYDAQGRRVRITPSVTMEWVVVSKKKEMAQWTQSPFCGPGDSGSILIDADGRVCGLLYTEMTGFCGPEGDQYHYVYAGLVTPMPLLINAVKSRTGCSLGLPC